MASPDLPASVLKQARPSLHNRTWDTRRHRRERARVMIGQHRDARPGTDTAKPAGRGAIGSSGSAHPACWTRWGCPSGRESPRHRARAACDAHQPGWSGRVSARARSRTPARTRLRPWCPYQGPEQTSRPHPGSRAHKDIARVRPAGSGRSGSAPWRRASEPSRDADHRQTSSICPAILRGCRDFSSAVPCRRARVSSVRTW
jgi:hypothetical protein